MALTKTIIAERVQNNLNLSRTTTYEIIEEFLEIRKGISKHTVRFIKTKFFIKAFLKNTKIQPSNFIKEHENKF